MRWRHNVTRPLPADTTDRPRGEDKPLWHPARWRGPTAAERERERNRSVELADTVCELLPSNGEPESGRKAA